MSPLCAARCVFSAAHPSPVLRLSSPPQLPLFVAVVEVAVVLPAAQKIAARTPAPRRPVAVDIGLLWVWLLSVVRNKKGRYFTRASPPVGSGRLRLSPVGSGQLRSAPVGSGRLRSTPRPPVDLARQVSVRDGPGVGSGGAWVGPGGLWGFVSAHKRIWGSNMCGNLGSSPLLPVHTLSTIFDVWN